MTNYRILHVFLLLLLGSLLVTRSVALEVVGSVGGTCPSVAAKDGYVYLCEGRGLTVLDARAAGDPVVIERVRLDAGTTCVRLDNDVAYVGTVDGKVRLYSLANPAAPSLLGSITLVGGSIDDAAFEGDHAFFANDGGVEIVNVSDKATPVAVSRYELPYVKITEIRHVCVRAGAMYVTAYPGCDVVDVRDPESIMRRAQLNHVSTLGFTPYGVASIKNSDDGVYVLWRGGRLLGGVLWLTDVTAALYLPDTSGYPKLLSTSYVPTDASDLLILENRRTAYVLGGWDYLVAMYDVSDPAAFRRISQSTLPGQVFEGALDGPSLLAAEATGLAKIEVGPNDALATTGRHNAINDVYGRDAVLGRAGGSLIAVTADALSTMDIDHPARPKPPRTVQSNDRIVSMDAIGRCLYFSDEISGLDLRYLTLDGTMARIDTLNLLSGKGLSGVHYGEIIVQGKTAWLAFLSGVDEDGRAGLVGLDVSNPLQPVVLGVSSTQADLTDATPSNPLLVLSGNRACVAADKLYFFDIADPSAPFFLSDLQVSPDYHFSRVSWFDDSVILCSRFVLRVVDASDAAHPVLLPSSSSLPGESSLKCVENGRAYIDRSGGLDIYRVVPGGEPVLLESFASRGGMGSVEMYGGHVYAMDSLDGLLVMKTNFPDHLAQRHLLGSDTGAADQNSDGVIDAADLALAMESARK